MRTKLEIEKEYQEHALMYGDIHIRIMRLEKDRLEILEKIQGILKEHSEASNEESKKAAEALLEKGKENTPPADAGAV